MVALLGAGHPQINSELSVRKGKRKFHDQSEVITMKIVVLNGSPKGDISVTMQYVHFLQKEFPQHDLKILNIAQRLQAIEKREETFREKKHR